MNWPAVIVAVSIIIAIGAWLRARAIEPANPLDDEPMEYEPHRDDRWGGDW